MLDDDDVIDEEEGPWAPVKQQEYVTEVEAGTLTDEQKKFRLVGQPLARSHHGHPINHACD